MVLVPCSMLGASMRPPAPSLTGLLLSLLLLAAKRSSIGLNIALAQGAPTNHDYEALRHLVLGDQGAHTVPPLTNDPSRPHQEDQSRPHPKSQQGPTDALFMRLATSGDSLTTDCPTQRVNVTNSTGLAAATDSNIT